ncbi:MAG TPA: TetR family transcriptional regulator [Kofleriaceae bacterium]
MFHFCQDVIVMAKAKRPERREDSLSREVIIDAAIAILDAEGEEGLTFRGLAARLETGAGAIYWHVENKTELLVAATNAIMARALGALIPQSNPKRAIRSIAGCLFQTIDDHPWVGTQLSAAPAPASTLQIYESIGQQVQALGVAQAKHFTAASTLVSYILGVSVQNAALGRLAVPAESREEYIGSQADRWKQLGAAEFPFLRSIASQLRKHDDRDEFLAGIDIIVAGLG